MDISEVARHSGLPASTLRFYEEKRLIASVGRRGLRRVFTAEVLDRLALIALARAAGFSLDEIGVMFPPGRRPRIDRAMLSAKAAELDGTIRRLTAMRDGLRPRRRLSCAESAGMPEVPPPAPRRRVWRAQPAAPRPGTLISDDRAGIAGLRDRFRSARAPNQPFRI